MIRVIYAILLVSVSILIVYKLPFQYPSQEEVFFPERKIQLPPSSPDTTNNPTPGLSDNEKKSIIPGTNLPRFSGYSLLLNTDSSPIFTVYSGFTTAFRNEDSSIVIHNSIPANHQLFLTQNVQYLYEPTLGEMINTKLPGKKITFINILTGQQEILTSLEDRSSNNRIIRFDSYETYASSKESLHFLFPNNQ